MKTLMAVVLTATMLLTLSSFAMARSCTDQNSTCVSTCMTYGIGKGRKQNPQPRPAVFCRNHCSRWYGPCLKSGCWSGELANMCGLDKH
jgi:hypothetical protein